ncbi:fatty acid oxidation complex subunit alpha FadJ [Myxococcota bacterium]|nr:fatty acid oxidation complex subunit alpha FadJ [Myxococcota bacterium]
MNELMQKAITFAKRSDGVGVVTIDIPGESQNTLKEGFQDRFAEVRREIEASGARAVVITSGKESSFLAGADIELLKTLTSAEQAEKRSKNAQKTMDEIDYAAIPFVAAIHGACLGGGLELALACKARVASDSHKTKLGLPEVQLGLLPGAGGTQRLPRLVGVEAALDLMLTGKQLDAKKAKKLGLVDEVVPRAILVDVAAKLALELAQHGNDRKSLSDRLEELTDVKALRELALAGNPAGRNLVFSQAEKSVRKKAGDHYPAPYKILEVAKHGLDKGIKAGLELEAKRFGELVMSDVARRLIEIFFATVALKKDNGTRNAGVKPREVHKVGVLGAGIMGHGIALVTATKANVPVRIKDKDHASVGRGLAAIREVLDEKVEKKRMREGERDRLMARISGTVDYSGFKGCDVVVEAVFEDLDVKHRVLKEVEAATGPETIFASNTSSIPITKIAEGAARPEMVVGMHYFSPVHKMPLLEVIRTKDTRDDVIATVVELGRKQGKTVIVVNDGVGFYTSRILGPYMNEAAWMLAEGIPVEVIDDAAVRFGFPVGPITLLDEVGIDTAAKVGKIAQAAFGDRMQAPGGLERLVEDGRTGRKGKKGFYLYGKKKGKQKEVDESVYKTLGIRPNHRDKRSLEELGERLALPMVAEAIRCLAEGVLRSARDGDIGAIFGLGFPPFRGGPFRYADALGPAELLRRMRGYADRHGKRFAPPELLVERAASGHRFHDH